MDRGKAKYPGFTTIELAIVVGIILVIAAIALPRLLGARKKASEASAVASIKAIQTAESLYQSAYPTKGYSPSLANLGSNGSTCETTSPTNACLLDPLLASGLKEGYVFDLLGDGQIPDQSYTLTVTPVSGGPGGCAFQSDQSGTIQFGYTPPAQGKSAANPPSGSNSPGSCGGN